MQQKIQLKKEEFVKKEKNKPSVSSRSSVGARPKGRVSKTKKSVPQSPGSASKRYKRAVPSDVAEVS